jgi:hypothetical protein
MAGHVGTFTTLRRGLAPLGWSEIVDVVSQYAREQGISRWDDAARELAQAIREQADAS